MKLMLHRCEVQGIAERRESARPRTSYGVVVPKKVEPKEAVSTTGGRPQELVLTDPRALRALAHEVRQQLLDILDANHPMTATEAAAHVGITPSAMSYHLRLLEKYGIVERADAPVDGATDGRERPWRLAASNIVVRPEGTSSRGAQRAFMTSVVNRLVAALERAEGGRARGYVSVSTPLLTDSEAQKVYDVIEDALRPYADRTPGGTNTPEDAQPFNVFYVAVREPEK